MSLVLLQIVNLVYIILLNIFYFLKKHLKTIENRLFKYLLTLNACGLVIELGCFYSVTNMDKVPVFNFIITRFLLVYYLCFIAIYTYYVFVISYKQDEVHITPFLNRIKIYCSILLIICSFTICSLPLEYYNDGQYVYSYGTAVDFLSIVTVLVMGTWLFVIFKNIKNIKVHKYMPILLFIFFALIGGIIQKAYPYILLTTPIETMIIFLMYFTIENPDVKLLDEVHKSKQISDNANEEKTLFLFNISQEIRGTTKVINNDADDIIDSKSIDNNKDSARNIKATTASLITSTNGLFDVSQIDSSTIKVYNNKYNIKNLIKEVIVKYEKSINSNIEFRSNIEHNLPEMLYGDFIGLKKVIGVIMENAIKYTETGFIELSINTIIKNDICRLIFTIEDSGIGIRSTKLNKLFVENNKISECNKIITLMNGTMIITSDYGKGTKVKIVLDQKIELEDNNEIKKYDQIYDNKKILLVNENDAGTKIIDKLLKGSNIELTICNTGKQCLDKIRSKEKYDLILIDENLEPLTMEEIVKKLYLIQNFNIPIILLTGDNSYEYNDKLKELGISNYIIKPVTKNNLFTKINIIINNNKE